jgi:ubiquinone/menaquinone biosynthesis C-methylase UbiE
MNKLKQFLESVPKAKILDVGTGRGNFISLIDHLYKDYEKMVGIDIFEPAINSASKFFENNPKIKIVNKDINNNDFPAEHFDIVCLSNSLHHLEDKKLTFQSMERLVKPEGYIIFNEMMKDNLNKKQISHLLLHHFAAKIDREIGRTHDETYNRSEIVDVIKEFTDFKVIDFWDMEVLEAGEPSEEEVKGFAGTVDRLLLQIADESIRANFNVEAEEIKDYILENGVEACTQLIVITQKI